MRQQSTGRKPCHTQLAACMLPSRAAHLAVAALRERGLEARPRAPRSSRRAVCLAGALHRYVHPDRLGVYLCRLEGCSLQQHAAQTTAQM